MNKKGFTLIELLVVISIIGILASLALVSYTGAQKQSRDTQRRSDLGQYRNGLETYAATKGGIYPTSLTTVLALCGFLSPNFISSCPADPLAGTYAYGFFSSSTSDSYVIYGQLETGGYWEICSTGKSGKVNALPGDSVCDLGVVPTLPPMPTPTPTPPPVIPTSPPAIPTSTPAVPPPCSPEQDCLAVCGVPPACIDSDHKCQADDGACGKKLCWITNCAGCCVSGTCTLQYGYLCTNNSDCCSGNCAEDQILLPAGIRVCENCADDGFCASFGLGRMCDSYCESQGHRESLGQACENNCGKSCWGWWYFPGTKHCK